MLVPLRNILFVGIISLSECEVDTMFERGRYLSRQLSRVLSQMFRKRNFLGFTLYIGSKVWSSLWKWIGNTTVWVSKLYNFWGEWKLKFQTKYVDIYKCISTNIYKSLFSVAGAFMSGLICSRHMKFSVICRWLIVNVQWYIRSTARSSSCWLNIWRMKASKFLMQKTGNTFHKKLEICSASKEGEARLNMIKI